MEKKLMKEIVAANGILRSAYSIAMREGKETNWKAFQRTLKVALNRQHKLMYPNS